MTDVRRLYSHYLPWSVKFITTFAKETTLFKSLTQTDQRLLIRSCILEITAIHDLTGFGLESDRLATQTFNSDIPNGHLEDTMLINKVFNKFGNVQCKLRKIGLTDVEMALLSALILFCPGR